MAGIKTQLKLLLGQIASRTCPALTRDVRSGDMGGKSKRIKRLIARAELKRLSRKGENASVEQALTGRWTTGNLMPDYYDVHADRFEKMFTGPHARIVDWLAAFAPVAGVSHVIEVGCGDGRALAAMSQRIDTISRWTGVDINTAIIDQNQKTYATQPKLNFIATDAVKWLDDNLEQGVLLMTYGGVMEYIAPETLRRWIDLVAQKNGAGILLTEPVDPDHNLVTDPNSHLWGTENSYSHNHRAILEAAGFRIVEHADLVWQSHRWVMILATPGSAPPSRRSET
jgi:predicted TPR repeat methyltransferase